MKSPLRQSLLLGILFTCATVLTVPSSARALVSSEVTLSGGYYKDYAEENQFPVFFYWNLNHITKSGVETYFDIGANNDLLPNTWGFFIYQAYVTVPLSSGFETAPIRKSRIQVGRQLLTEGFELSFLDGVQIPLYWSAQGGLLVFGGGNYSFERKQVDFDAQIYGISAHQNFLGALWKAGYIQKRKAPGSEGTLAQHFGHASLYRAFEQVPFRPTVIARSQVNLKPDSAPAAPTERLQEAHAELDLYPSDTVALGALYLKQDVSALDPRDMQLVYRLFSLTPQQSVAGFLSWSPTDDLKIQGTVRHTNYDSQAGDEVGNEQELSITWLHQRNTWIPSVTHINSYGGEFFQPALIYRRDLSDAVSLRLQAAAAKTSKLNGIAAWAYHGRGGMDFKLAPRLSLLALAEAERNHLYEVDVRGIAFLSYFLF